ncbi:MAG: hypothetical protein JNM56_12885, partial [Planctomycetia bacterium]|nr:hypothetical protein [Planctomycetia bacterium]
MCQQWLYGADWQQTMRAGKPIRRPPGTNPPCWKCPKSEDKRRPGPESELSAKNWLAYDYYRRCLADSTGLLPRDMIVVENNA